jgi:hypothetical protein
VESFIRSERESKFCCSLCDWLNLNVSLCCR